MKSKIIKTFRHAIKIISTLAIALCLCTFLLADTITLMDGTILVGKVVGEKGGRIVFTNSYGVFNIKKKDVVERFETESYEEDVEIHKKLGKDVDENTITSIKKDYTAGEEKKMELEKRERSDPGLWAGGMVSISGTFINPFGNISDVFPYGYSGQLAVDQGLEMIMGERNIFMPGIRVEGGYLFFKKDKAQVSGLFCSAGPLWMLPVMDGNRGNILFGLFAGISILDIEKDRETSEDYEARSNTFTGQSILGFQYTFGDFSLFINARYIYIYDKDVLFSSAGGEFGAGYRVW